MWLLFMLEIWIPHLQEFTEKNPIFWKLHVAGNMIKIAKFNGMIGIVSAEQFENKHYVMAQLKRLFQGLPHDEMRCAKLVQRQQRSLDIDIQRTYTLFNEADKKRGKGRKRENYNSKGTRLKNMENLQLHDSFNDEGDSGILTEYFYSPKGNLIKKELSDYVFFMTKGNVPDEWVEQFHDLANLGSKAA